MKKVILIIRDGWGYRNLKKGNRIKEAKIPNTDFLMKNYPNCLLNASGEAVGLPKGYQGNSEVGHLTIGSGRIINQSLTRINTSIKDKSFFKNKELINTINNCKKNNSSLHLIGLLQTQGVHSHINHLYAILKLCKINNFKRVIIHVITDGRDAPVNEAIIHIKNLKKKIKTLGFGTIGTISGRYFAMDRDNRWKRTKKAYETIVNASSKKKYKNIINCIKDCYKNNESDEFIIPKANITYSGFSKNDSVIFWNFRTDRLRQLTKAICEKRFNYFKRNYIKIYATTLTSYYKSNSFNVAFKNIILKNLLGEVIANNNLKQLRISETEKYAHVTFFFNGQKEIPYKNEDRILIPSPKVSTYDLLPEMSAFKITKRLIKEINKEFYDFIVVNLVNCDMVGHTGKKLPTIKAIETVDSCVGDIVKAGIKKDYSLLIFGDHGNAEDQTIKWRTSHTTNKVPFILVSNMKNIKLKKNKGLSNIAPTVLKILKIKKPKEMTGTSIF